jgi:hypothetical protein
MGSWDQ